MEIELDKIREKVRREMGEGRFFHCLSVGKMAKEIAKAQELSEEDCERAEAAGLVHDIAKEFSKEQNQKYVEAGGLDPKLLEDEAENYVHAEVGAEVVKEMGLDKEIVRAVRHHTIPVRGMSELEKIVFLADKVGRRELPEELEVVKEMAFSDLDRAMLIFLELQEKELAKRGISHSPETKELKLELRKMFELKKAKKLERGDTVGVVSLSTGVLGEKFVQHEVEIFERRLKEEFGLKIKYMDNARKGMAFLKAHPEARANDLKQAFLDKEVKIIWCAIGGEGGVEIAPYILNEEFRTIVRENPKIFMGFSDTTCNHLMLYKLGLRSFYGPALLPDVAELSAEMLPYTKEWILKMFENPSEILVQTSAVWYKAREKFDESQVGVPAEAVKEERDMVWRGPKKMVRGKLLGGCIDSLYGLIEREKTEKGADKIFPERNEWRDKILFIETSDNQPEPDLYKKMIQALEERGVFGEVRGVLAGKPMDEKYFNEYLESLEKVAEKYEIPVVYNLNFGHATPRMIIPYGGECEVNGEKQEVRFLGKMLED